MINCYLICACGWNRTSPANSGVYLQSHYRRLLSYPADYILTTGADNYILYIFGI